MYEHHLKMN